MTPDMTVVVTPMTATAMATLARADQVATTAMTMVVTAATVMTTLDKVDQVTAMATATLDMTVATVTLAATAMATLTKVDQAAVTAMATVTLAAATAMATRTKWDKVVVTATVASMETWTEVDGVTSTATAMAGKADKATAMAGKTVALASKTVSARSATRQTAHCEEGLWTLVRASSMWSRVVIPPATTTVLRLRAPKPHAEVWGTDSLQTQTEAKVSRAPVVDSPSCSVGT